MKFRRLLIILSFLIVLFERVIAEDSFPNNLIVELIPSDGESGDQFGVSVSISGDTIVIGAFLKEDGGAAYIFEENPDESGQWEQTAKLTADDGRPGDSFGWAVAIEENVLVVGAYTDVIGGFRSGSAYIFERDVRGGSENWNHVAKLIGDGRNDFESFLNNNDGRNDFDTFGWSVGISGDTVLVGAPRSYYKGIRGGVAYVFDRNAGGINNWGQVAKLSPDEPDWADIFGSFVDIDEDLLVIGAVGDDDHGINSGAAYIFERNVNDSNNWIQVAKLTAADATSHDLFGEALSISGDTVVVGASSDGDHGFDSGSAYVFERKSINSNEWVQMIELVAEDGRPGEAFGGSLEINDDIILVGTRSLEGLYASRRGTGAAYLFERNAGDAPSWIQKDKLVSADGALDSSFGVLLPLAEIQ